MICINSKQMKKSVYIMKQLLQVILKQLNYIKKNGKLLKKLQMKLQMGAMAGAKPDDDDMQRFQGITSLLFSNPTVSKYMLAEMRLQQALADIFKIITEAANIDMELPGMDN